MLPWRRSERRSHSRPDRGIELSAVGRLCWQVRADTFSLRNRGRIIYQARIEGNIAVRFVAGKRISAWGCDLDTHRQRAKNPPDFVSISRAASIFGDVCYAHPPRSKPGICSTGGCISAYVAGWICYGRTIQSNALNLPHFVFLHLLRRNTQLGEQFRLYGVRLRRGKFRKFDHFRLGFDKPPENLRHLGWSIGKCDHT